MWSSSRLLLLNVIYHVGTLRVLYTTRWTSWRRTSASAFRKVGSVCRADLNRFVMRGTNPLYGTIRGKCLEVLAHKKVTAGGEFKMRVIAGAPGGSTDRLFQVLRACVFKSLQVDWQYGRLTSQTKKKANLVSDRGSGATQPVTALRPSLPRVIKPDGLKSRHERDHSPTSLGASLQGTKAQRRIDSKRPGSLLQSLAANSEVHRCVGKHL